MYLGAPYAFNKTKFTYQKYFFRVFGVMCFFFLYFRGSFVYSMCTKVAPLCALIEYTLLFYIYINQIHMLFPDSSRIIQVATKLLLWFCSPMLPILVK
jgi:hypothetical protein